MKYINLILAIALVCLILYAGEFQIEMNPFNIQLHNWKVVAQSALFAVSSYVSLRIGYKLGYEDGRKEILTDIIKASEKTDDGVVRIKVKEIRIE